MRLLRSPLEVEFDTDSFALRAPSPRAAARIDRNLAYVNSRDASLLPRKSDVAQAIGVVLSSETKELLNIGGMNVPVADYVRALAVSCVEFQGRGDGTDAYLAEQMLEDPRITQPETDFLETVHAELSLGSLGVLMDRLFPARVSLVVRAWNAFDRAVRLVVLLPLRLVRRARA